MSSFHQSFEAIGSSWTIDIYDSVTANDADALLDTIYTKIEMFDKTYSRFRSDSLVTKLSQNKGKYLLPPDSIALLKLYQQLYEITDEQFTPLIGSVLTEAGYDINYSLQPKQLHPPLCWQDSFEYFYDTCEIVIKKPTLLDFGAAGKGYLVDILSNVIREYGYTSFCVDGSGDMYYSNVKNEPLTVGMEHPDNTDQAIGVATILNQSICGSATNRRAWQDFHHVINPHTLSSPTHIKAVWVIASTALLADALTTCLFFTSAETLSSQFSFEYAIVNSNNTLEKSLHFPGEFF